MTAFGDWSLQNTVVPFSWNCFRFTSRSWRTRAFTSHLKRMICGPQIPRSNWKVLFHRTNHYNAFSRNMKTKSEFFPSRERKVACLEKCSTRRLNYHIYSVIIPVRYFFFERQQELTPGLKDTHLEWRKKEGVMDFGAHDVARICFGNRFTP